MNNLGGILFYAIATICGFMIFKLVKIDFLARKHIKTNHSVYYSQNIHLFSRGNGFGGETILTYAKDVHDDVIDELKTRWVSTFKVLVTIFVLYFVIFVIYALFHKMLGI